MKYQRMAIAIAILALLVWSVELYGRGGRGGGGGGRGGGGGGGYRGGGGGYGSVGPYGGGGGGGGGRSSGTVVGPSGRSTNTGSKSGSINTKGGGTIDYKGAGGSVTGPGGGGAGKVVGGIEVTGPGGKSVSKGGSAGAIVGPGGKGAGSKTTVKGVNGKAGSISQGKAAVGPGGAYGSKSGAVVGPNGGWGAYGSRAVATGHHTAFVKAGTLPARGAYVRAGFGHYNCFHGGWWAQHPVAWRAAAWTTAAAVWAVAGWGSVSSECGYPEEPVIYDYGSDLVYENDQVYYQGEQVATAEEYAEQATQFANQGQEAKVSEKEEWISLGVFAMIQGDEKDSNNLFQFAINKDGILRGNYYNGLTDEATPIYGSVDKKSQRAAWTVGNRKEPVYETGIGNLTEPETSMLVHFGPNRTQQWTLIRLEQKKEESK
jgi:hypothetical protein